VTQDRASGCVCASLSLVGRPTPIRPGTSPAASSTQDHWLPVSDPRPGPRHWRCSTRRQALGRRSDVQVLTHDRLQRPGQSTTRQPGPRLGGAAGVLAPHMPTPGAPVPADRHQQGGRSPAQRLVRQLPRDGVPGSSHTPQRRHQTLVPSSASRTRHARTARSGSRRWPTTTRPSSSRRLNVPRSGQPKVASGTSRFPDGRPRNRHPRKTSTPTPVPTRQPPSNQRLHPQL
jgi:hypothetical protein